MCSATNGVQWKPGKVNNTSNTKEEGAPVTSRNRSPYRYVLRVCLAGLCLPLLMGQGCPSPMMLGNGIGGLGGGLGAMPMLLRQQFTSAPFTATFSPTETGVTIRVVVSANDAASRPTVTVTDSSGTVVASVSNPSDAVSETAFTSAGTGAYSINVTEAGTPATIYIVTVTRAWDGDSDGSSVFGGGMMGDGSGGGMMGGGNASGSTVLRQTFTATPFDATFSPVTGETLRVVVTGNNGGSRLTVTVTDPSGSPVATVGDPTTNVSQTTFTASSAGTYTVSVTETGTPSTSYLLRVM
jgi:hypothetical protein